MTGRSWDGDAYHRVSGPMEAMAMPVLDRLSLRGDETVIDAGCGSGRVTRHLVERVPHGRVIGFDSSAAMAETARSYLGDAADVVVGDLLEIDLEVLGRHTPVDAVFSTGTFHHVLDHDRLFVRLAGVLAPGGPLVAQCGAEGNISNVLAAAAEVAADARFAEALRGVDRKTTYETPEVTKQRLIAAGFTDVRCWTEPNAVVPDDCVQYLETIVLGGHAQRLGPELGRAYVEEVVDRLSVDGPASVDYVRLNIDARRG
ncbi:MAG TPA: methyltransferase domain-containing protein [Acidimicrobiales bacterium]|nr:methyltransferase domain-containing protein [Acidimicrobiales bacterium]